MTLNMNNKKEETIEQLHHFNNNHHNYKKKDLSYYININEIQNEYSIFLNACKKGDVEVVKSLFDKNPNINISDCNDEPFWYSCFCGHLEVAQWLFEIRKDMHDVICCDAFMGACENGHLEVAQWLLELKPNIINFDNITHTYTFYLVCKKGHLKVAQWLLEINQEKDKLNQENDKFNFEDCFIIACENGQIEVAKWLLELKPNIDITAENNRAFYFSCYYYKYNVMTWLQSLKPWLYTIVKNPVGTLKPKINSIKEQRFYKRKYAVWLSSSMSPNKKCILFKLPSDVSREIIMML